MLALHVIEGYNKACIATIQRKGIRYRGRLHLPVLMDKLDGGVPDPAGSFSAAALGAMTFGAAGAIVGSIAGRRGRTAVKITTTEGTEMVCAVASDEFPALYVEIQRLSALAATGYRPPEPARVNLKHIAGPFYYLQFGVGWFIGALTFTAVTLGFGWLFLIPIAAYLDRWLGTQSSDPVIDQKSFAPSGSKLARAEGDLDPPAEDPTATP